MSITHLVASDDWLFTQSDATQMEVGPVYSGVYGTAVSGGFTVLTFVSFLFGTSKGGVAAFSTLSVGSRNYLSITLSTTGALEVATGAVSDNGSVVGVTSRTVQDTVTFPGVSVWTRLTSSDGTNITAAYSIDGTTWTDIGTYVLASLGMVGGVLTGVGSGTLTTLRCMDTQWSENTESFTMASIPQTGGLYGPAVTVEPRVHAIVGAQLGDMEYDIGKSVPWASLFCSDVFITDINQGTQRYWVVDWAASYPSAKTKTLTVDYFKDAAAWRQAQFAAADAGWGYEDDDWVVFIDGHEGLSLDLRSSPDDVGTTPFSSWMHREITRAGGSPTIALPYFVFLRDTDVTQLVYNPLEQSAFRDLLDRMGLASLDETDPEVIEEYNTELHDVAIPWYLQADAMVRMVKVSELRNVNFDWTTLDTLTPVYDPAVKVQLVSYGYAHWAPYDWDPVANELPALGPTNDLGWALRNRLSAVVPIPGLPIGTWQDPANDPTGEDGPYVQLVADDLVTTGGSGAAVAVLTPMYERVVRINMRDGVWYESKGSIPLGWDPVTEQWLPQEDVEDWYGVVIEVYGTGD